MPRFAFFRRALCLGAALCLLAGCGASPAASPAQGAVSSAPASSAAVSEAASEAASSPAGAEGSLFPEGEYRAMWISYLEWQNVDFSSQESFGRDVEAMLDNCANLEMNVVLGPGAPLWGRPLSQ